MVKIDNYKQWYIICPTCGWFAPFCPTVHIRSRPKLPRSKVCCTCNTELLWEGLDHSLNKLMLELRQSDPQSSSRCGNSWCGFTSKLALTALGDENDIGWWLK